MSGTKNIEMKLHKLADRIGRLEAELKELKNEYATRKESVYDGRTDS